jgi:predicted transcriptional regulator of viral defense system
MKTTTIEKAIAIFEQHSGLLRASQAIRLGIAPRTLYALRDSGRIVEVTRGAYRLPGTLSIEHSDLVQVALRVPKGVICLVSALAFHNLTTQIPRQVYVALPLEAEKPRLVYPPVRLFWLSQPAYSAGMELHLLEGVTVRIFNREKSIADCFKYRSKIGLDVALAALKDGLGQGCKLESLIAYARIDRVEKIMRPYLEALRLAAASACNKHTTR